MRISALVLIGSLSAGLPAQVDRRTTEKAGFIPFVSNSLDSPFKSREMGRSRAILQFHSMPNSRQLEQLAARGARVHTILPPSAILATLPDNLDIEGLDVRVASRPSPHLKISPLIGRTSGTSDGRFVAEFYPDVDEEIAIEILREEGIPVLRSRDLLAGHYLVQGDIAGMIRLAQWDEVAYIFPGAKDLTREGLRPACEGAFTTLGKTPQAVPLIGDGWGGAEHKAVELRVMFLSASSALPVQEAQSAVLKAFQEWTRHVEISLVPSSDPAEGKTVTVTFAKGAHGDPYRFNARSVSVAHTFYPAPPNPEPLAGDMHFDDDRLWTLGGELDLFTVALHEFGHALGLGHAGDPEAVMYPYYRQQLRNLSEQDITALRTLYPARAEPARQ